MQKERELKEKELLLDELKELERELSKKQKDAEKLKAPSKKELKQIEQIHQKIHDMKTKLDAIGLTTKIIAKSNISGRVFLDEKSVEFGLSRGKQERWTSHQVVKIQINKIGTFEVKSGSRDIKEMKAELDELEINYEKATAPYDTQDIEKLKKLLSKKEELEKEIKRLRKEIKKQAKDGRSPIEKEIAGLKRRIKSNWKQIPENSEFKKYRRYKDKTIAQQELSEKINDIEKEIEGLKKQRKILIKNNQN